MLALVEHDPNEVPVLYEERAGIAWITLNRPEKLNALNAEVFRRLAESLDRLEAGDCAVGILHGAAAHSRPAPTSRTTSASGSRTTGRS